MEVQGKIFDFDALKKVPESLKQSITETPAPEQKQKTGGVDDMFSHTAAQPTVENSNSFYQAPPPGNTNPNAQTSNGRYPDGANTQINLGDLFPPQLVVEVVDNVMSKVAAQIIGGIKKQNIPPQMLQASEKEKAVIQPVLKSYLDSLNIKMSPLNALIITLATIYGAKGIEVANKADGIKKGEPVTGKLQSEFAEQQIPLAATGRKPVFKNGKPSRYLQKKHNLK